MSQGYIAEEEEGQEVAGYRGSFYIIRVLVRMPFNRQFFVRFFDVIVGCDTCNTQHRVIIICTVKIHIVAFVELLYCFRLDVLSFFWKIKQFSSDRCSQNKE